MRCLIIYFSRTGNTEKISSELADRLNADIERIIDRKKRKGIIGWLKSGRDSFKKRTTDIEKIEHSPDDYDLVIVGTPVWAGNLTPAVRTFLQIYHGEIDNIAFFSTSKSGETSELYKNMTDIIDMEPISTLTITEKEVKKEKYSEKIGNFIDRLSEYIDF